MGIIKDTEVCMPEVTAPLSPDEVPVLFKKPRKKAPTKAERFKAFAVEVHDEEHMRGRRYIQEFLQRPVFDLQHLTSHWSGAEFPGTIQALYGVWQAHRDAGFPKESLDPLEITRRAWEGAQADPSFLEVFQETPEDLRYFVWLFDEPDTQEIANRIPEGFPEWIPGEALETQAALKTRAARTKKSEEEGEAAIKKPKKEPKPKKPPEPKDLRTMFLKRLESLSPESLFRPWMATKALRLVTTREDLQEWADRALADHSRYRAVPMTGELMPVIAVDTENAGANGGASGLDTRMVNGLSQLDCAGICLSADGVEGLYVPITHEDGNNCPREAAAEVLQGLFDQSLVVYFNAKYDREVLRNTLGMTLRPYPYFEDVQILQFLLDPKSEEEEEVSSFESAGLKALAKKYLDCEMIELGTLAKVKARYTNPETGKTSERTTLAPFNWIPTNLALPYAAGDGIFTWLLWEKLHEEARTMKFVHKVDHRLADALAWIERQRPLIDVDKHREICRWHAEKLKVLGDELTRLSGIPEFNPGSNPQLARVLFETYGFPVIKRSEKTGAPSTDADVIEELLKSRKNHPFLTALVSYREYSALHPSNLRYDPRDLTARLYFKQCTVAGGRLAAMGGKFEKDGGFGLNPQAIVSVGGNKWVTLRRLRLEDTEDLGETFDPSQVAVLADEALHPSCLKVTKEKVRRPNPAYVPPPPPAEPRGDMDDYVDETWHVREAERLAQQRAHEAGVTAMEGIPEFLEEEVEALRLDVPRVVNNHIARYCGEWWSLAKDEESITMPSGVVIPLDPPKDVDANEVVNLRSLFVAPEGYSFFVVDYCLDPEVRLLTKDLRWVPAGDVSKGDSLVGFDEHLPERVKGQTGRRRLKESTVTHVKRVTKPCCRVTFASGKEIVCSDDHMWLTRVRRYGSPTTRGQYDWCKSRDLQVGHEVARLCETWEVDDTREGGYLGGVYDGEGYISAGTLGCGQRPGQVMDSIQAALTSQGIPFVVDPHPSGVERIRIQGGRRVAMDFLGRFRPERLIANFWRRLDGSTLQSQRMPPDRVVGIEPLGDREVVAIQTDAHTFIAEGLASHNCNIEMRVAANVSREPKFIDEFMTGSGDFHTLTAKNVFPEFGQLQQRIKELQAQDPRGLDPAIQAKISAAKAKMKKLRSLAKIINFALLYGGTEHAIYEGMKAEDPTITKEKASAMVATYWDSVPFFKEWAQTQMARARDTFTCKTASGRRIDFKSAMRTQKITEPLPEHWTNYRTFWDLKRQSEAALKAGNREKAAGLEARAQELRRDKATGVANLGDYKKFLSKIQRVSTNAPLQGLAGDFMRAALGYIHQWALETGIGDILLLHATVHDEIDFSVKNEYVPFVLPRIIRLMKLREMHATMHWPVPIECDCEYGASWDVKEHLTGDDTHAPAGYTRIPGLEHYIPAMFDPATVDAIREAIRSSDPAVRQEACAYLRGVTHPRCHGNVAKLEGLNPHKASQALTAILQLHEYWLLDSSDGSDDETLQDYQIRMGLIPGEVVARPAAHPVPVTAEPLPAAPSPVAEEAPVAQEPEPLPEPESLVAQDDRPLRPRIVEGFPVLRDLTSEEIVALQAALGVGANTVRVRVPSGDLIGIPKTLLTEIPAIYLEMEAADAQT